MKIAYRAQSLIDAQLIKDWLADAYIDSEIQGQYLQGGIGGLPSMDLVKILVPEEDLERARKEIQRWEIQHLGKSSALDQTTSSVDPIALILLIAVLVSAALVLFRD